jgi:cellulose synthase/poly-beta-1,6-N-acetylglucosamine synthase-like glycosyltransferase
LLQAALKAARCGASADQALLNEGLMRDEDFYRLLTEHVRAPFYDGEIPIDGNVDPAEAVSSGGAALAPNAAGLRYVTAPRGPEVRLLIRAAQAGLTREDLAIASPRQFETALTAAAKAKIAEAGAFALKAQDQSLSADVRVSIGQIAAGALAVVTIIALGLTDAELLPPAYSIVLWLIFGASIWLRLSAAMAGEPARREASIDEVDLPVYSVVLALHREANMVDQLVAALDAIDYPRAKMDVVFVLEEDDHATRRALEWRSLAGRYKIIDAPRGKPQTKPRALNIALPFARGCYVVVYDAEDKPESDQLRRAVARFESEPELGCLQARLAIEQTDRSWLTMMFAIEYFGLFGAINPGLAVMRAPIALGGTSNHFRTDVLRRVGAWDAWNVAEDADLGLRLARFGVRVATFDSDTYEEAPATLAQWLAQRRRWHKGWLQTALVHSRDPARLVRELGFRGALCAFALMAGAIFGAMFGPFFALHTLWRCAYGDLLAPHTPFETISTFMTIAVLTTGLISIFAPAVLGLRRRRLHRLIWATPFLPFYYCLISVAAWLAVYDLIFKPFHWFKTEHGARRPPPRPLLRALNASLLSD